MRVVMLSPPEELLAERRRIGADRWDEIWEGVLHMVPPPSAWHQQMGTELIAVLLPVAKARGWLASYETGLFRSGAVKDDYRVPDLMVYRPDARSQRGVEGRAEVVIELLSPDDESRDKLPFYESLGVGEVFLIDPDTRAVELYVLRGGKLHAVLPDPSGGIRSPSLGLALAPVEGPKLRLTWASGQTEI